MDPQHNDLTGIWTGLIVHTEGAQKVTVEIMGTQNDGSLYGTYSFPGSKPHEDGGDFTAELYGSWLFIKLEKPDRIRFHVQIIGKDSPEMMYGAIPPREP